MNPTQTDFAGLLTAMRLPASLQAHAPLSAARRLRTIRLAESPLVADLPASFDDTCLLTVPEGEQKLGNLKLTLHAGKKHYSGLHIAVLSNTGMMNVVLGDDHARMFIGSQSTVRAAIQLFRQPTLFIGDRCTFGQARLIVANCDMVIGEDAQFSDEIIVQGSDQHPIMDLDTGRVLNAQRRSVRIDAHVWVGRRALLMPDIHIEAGSIVAAGALVNANVPANVIVAGVPARVVRERVAWAREF